MKDTVKRNYHYWLKTPRIDSYLLLRILVILNIVLFIYYITSLQESNKTKESNPCIVLINTKDSDNGKQKLEVESKVDIENNNDKIDKIDNTNLIESKVKEEIISENKVIKNVNKNAIVVQPQESIGSNDVQLDNIWWTTESRGKYSVIRNFIPSDESADTNSSVTLTTQGTYEFLQHSQQLCQRWDGPISIGVYSPGDDFKVVLSIITFLRQCSDNCVKKNISWHIVYDKIYGPELTDISFPESYIEDIIFDCSRDNLETVIAKFNTNFRKEHGLPYPINVVRNVARLSAKTRYVFASDIELYPSVNIVSMFMDLLNRERVGSIKLITNDNPHVYVIPIFEVNVGIEPPTNKTQLKLLLKSNKAIFFHKWVCDVCQKFPDRDKWINEIPTNNTLNVFRVTRRYKAQSTWEPLYIGTNNEPLYDERLSWDGKRDKMTQMYEMCLMNYDLAILDNAFLVHAPGIKHINKNEEIRRLPFMEKNRNIYIRETALLRKKYGNFKC